MFRSARFVVFIGLTGLLAPLSAQSQPVGAWRYTVEVFGNIGHGGFYHGDSKWGTGRDYGGGIGIRPFAGSLQAIGFELQVADLATEWVQEGGAWSKDLASRLVSGHVLYHFRSPSRVQPYLFGGLGRVKANYTFYCENCVYDVDPVTSELVPGIQEERVEATKTGVSIGGGLKIAIQRHVSIRPEFLLMDTTIGSGWNWSWLRVQIGIGLHL